MRPLRRRKLSDALMNESTRRCSARRVVALSDRSRLAWARQFGTVQKNERSEKHRNHMQEFEGEKVERWIRKTTDDNAVPTPIVL